MQERIKEKLMAKPPNKNTPKPVHVTPHKDGWQVKKEGASKASKVTDTKKEAEIEATKIGKKEGSEVVIHGKNGIIQEKK